MVGWVAQGGSRRFLNSGIRGVSGRRFKSVAAGNQEKKYDIAGGAVGPLGMNQYVFVCKETKEAAIIDSGASKEAELKPFMDWIKSNDYKLTKLLQTHAHIDHVAGLGLVKEQVADATLYLHSDDLCNYERAEESAKNYGFGDIVALPNSSTIQDLQGVETVTLGNLELEVLFTPGHAPGHVCFYEKASKLMFGGDLIFQGGIGRTDLPYSSPQDMTKSLKYIVETVDEDVVILPGHGPPTSMGEEKKNNAYLS
mmetsp:Transcript_12638/g.20425  ORF Transcript_12638/g.20425 Transcript_12638/m.20425 type:complete len:254 (+) Transcript_12638:290-1051(+)